MQRRRYQPIPATTEALTTTTDVETRHDLTNPRRTYSNLSHQYLHAMDTLDPIT